MTAAPGCRSANGRCRAGCASSHPSWSACSCSRCGSCTSMCSPRPRACCPSPTAIGAELVLRWDIIFEDMLVTATNALIGLVVGSLLAVVLAGLAATARPIDGMLTPLVAALAVVPIVAITPILNTMFGASSQFGRIAVATIAAFIPVFVNVLRGLRQTRPVHRDVLRASAATERADLPAAHSAHRAALPDDGTADRGIPRRDRRARRGVLRRTRRRDRHRDRDLRQVGARRPRLGVRGRRHPDRPRLLPRDLAAGEAGDEALVGLTGTARPCTTCTTEPERNSMRTSTRRGLAVVVHRCHHGLRARRVLGPRDTRRQRRRVGGLRSDHRHQAAAAVAAAGPVRRLLRGPRPGLLRGGGLRQRRDHPVGRRHRPAGRARRGRRRLRDRLGAEGARHARGHRRRADRHRAGVPEVGHPAGLVGRRRHRRRSPTSRASASARGASATSGRSSPRWPPRTSTRATVSITTQDFSMNALLDRDVDAAQAMTYNEWAQILEVVNPDTGELYQPEDFDVVSYEDTDGAMLQDAIWADTAAPRRRPGVRRRRRALPQGRHEGLDLRAGQPGRGRDDHVRRRDQRRGRLPGRPRAPAVADERGQQAHLGRRRLRSDRPGRVGQDGRGRALGQEPGRHRADHHRARRVGVLERVHRAGARRAQGRRASSWTASTRRSTSS